MRRNINGFVAPGFERVQDTFARSFGGGGEVGASVHVRRGDEVLVHLWGGVSDLDTGALWKEDTLGLLFSATKGLTASCFLHLEDRGGADLDQPVREIWPEINAAVGALSIRSLLSHRGGLIAVDDPLPLTALDDREALAAILARQTPCWEPGTDQGYHAVSFGLYAQEVFQRLTGRTLGHYLAEELAGPLGAELFLGLPESEHGRVASLVPAHKARLLAGFIPRAVVGQRPEGRVARAMLTEGSDTRRAFSVVEELGARHILNWRRRDVWTRELPWGGAFGTAEGLARLYAGLLNGHVSARAIARVSPPISWSEHDRVLHKPMGFSQGFVKEGSAMFSPHSEGFGHPGAGGCLGWADPVSGVSIGYVMNHMSWRVRSPRALALCHALYACL